MGMVKGVIEDLTYDILTGCDLEDTDENYGVVFRWSMNQDLQAQPQTLVEKFKQEHPTMLRGGSHE
jgi:hypothetical protein